MTVYKPQAFKSVRARMDDFEIIMDMLRKPRTTEEIAERLGRDTQSTGNMLAHMARRGEIVQAEKIKKFQIWERVK